MQGELRGPGEGAQLGETKVEGLLDLGFRTQAGDSVEGTHTSEPMEHAGARVGRFELIEPIGEGGFGTVWRAGMTSAIQREIALKLIKRGMDTREIIARFNAEREALAMMEHPNIASVVDAGTTPDGRPYFAMELVHGEPLTSFCDNHHLGIMPRLELFIHVCLAVQHAHQKAILHRDLKPSNILVASVDGKAVPKVIDFGVAKALAPTGEKPTQTSLARTRQGTVVGTPLYMSPEQAGSMPDVDTRSDIYALGIVLHELLTGRTPWQQAGKSPLPHDELLRLILAGNIPRPSTTYATRSPATEEAAARRDSDPARIRKILRGDLDWIVLKALETDRDRRYGTATGLADDLGRFLRKEPVTAAAPTWGYRFSKFAARNRLPLTAAAVVLVTLVTATGVSLWQASKAKEARAVAEKNARMAEQKSIEARQKGEEAEANFIQARDAVETYLSRVADDGKLRDPAFKKIRKELLETALPFYREMGERRGEDPVLLSQKAWALGRLGSVFWEMEESRKGIDSFREALAIDERLVTLDPANREYRRARNLRQNNLGMILRQSGNDADAARMMGLAVVTLDEMIREAPDNRDFPRDLSQVLINLGETQADMGRLDEAIGSFNRATALREGLAKLDPGQTWYAVEVSAAHTVLARLLYQAGRVKEGEERFRKGFAILEKVVADYPENLGYAQRLANEYYNQGFFVGVEKFPEATLEWSRKAVEISSRIASAKPEDIASRSCIALARHNSGEALRRLKREDEAKKAFVQSRDLSLVLAARIPENPDHLHYAARSVDALGKIERDSGNIAGALLLYRDCRGMIEKALAIRPSNMNYRFFAGNLFTDLADCSSRTGDSHGMMDACRSYGDLYPGAWQEQEAAAALVTRFMPVLEKETGASPEQKNQEIEAAADLAIALLKKSMDLGNPATSNLWRDARFASLRGKPGFVALAEMDPGPGGDSPSSFTFDYQQEDPGKRVWKRDGNRWVETQPSGKQASFSITRRLRVRGMAGTEIMKDGGGAWIFVPDKNAPAPVVFLMRTMPGEWFRIGVIGDIE